jgi:glycosyltransferase involved in cell wall biosynthesis
MREDLLARTVPRKRQSSNAVSVTIPTRDRPQLLARAVEAILTQDHDGPIECVVVFDQSEPHEIPLRSDLPAGRTVKAVKNTRKPGLAGARNSGILAASNPIMGFCDDDDEWLPGKLAAQLSLMDQHPGASVVATGILVHFNGRDRTRPAPRRPLNHGDFLEDRIMEVNPCTVLSRRELILDRIGLVDEEIPGGYAEDYEWLLRASAVAPIRCVPEPLVRIYWHSHSFYTEQWRVIIDGLLYVLNRHPGFSQHPRGLARIQGQIAFAYAGLGEYPRARSWARKALRHNIKEKRAYLALACSTGLVRNDSVVRFAKRFGRNV